ncbi:coiled-coil domain-containing protein 158 [Sabethes cyaneus]|uniref:coiled-coil domain-containing protein 158 n=1 Tax=Sabethes cyaneus TaxID=53552 RepID=UPI00237DE438|nr:coiled-coil domain-containing protein 158 [Sabethes cyaneus]
MNSDNARITEKSSAADKIDIPLYKKKTFDFTDYAYREAVNRLKFLLTEAYEPTKVATSIYYRGVDDAKSEVSDNQSIVERPSFNEVSKYFNPSGFSRSGSGAIGSRRFSFMNTGVGLLKPVTSNVSLQPPSVCSVTQSQEVAQPPPELLGFIEKQESYIEQLEKESQYCREELATLLKKVKDVVSENEALTDRVRSKAMYRLDSSESEDFDLERTRDKRRLSGPNIVFESRISELEAQLAQSQIDLKKLFDENEENKRKLAHGTSDASCSDIYRKQVENLQRDKQSLEETVRKLQLSIDQLKDSEANNFNKSQRSRDMIEHVAFERNQAEIEIRRLKDELDRQHERVREIQHEMTKRIAEERSNAERRYTFQVDQLGGDLSSQWEQATKLQLEVERMKRIESDYKREINQKNSQLDELKLELKNKMAIFMSDLNQASAEKQSLEQEITSLRLQLERTERQSKVEVSRLTAEITSLRQRLDRADADTLHCKRENLKLADEVASLEKELTLGELNKETRPSKELAKIISDMEAKHAATVSELEGMVQDQKELMEKLTTECKGLTHKLEDTTLKHKEEKKELRQTNNELMERLKQVWENYKKINPTYKNQLIKCTESLESDSNISSVSNCDPKLLPGQVVQRPTTLRFGQCNQSHNHNHKQAKYHGQNREHPTGSIPTDDSNRMASCPEPAPSMITMNLEEASLLMKNEASPECHVPRSPMKICQSRCLSRSRSLDVLTSNDRRESVTIQPLNQTAPEALVESHESPIPAVTDRQNSLYDNNHLRLAKQSHLVNMYQNVQSPWNSINPVPPTNILRNLGNSNKHINNRQNIISHPVSSTVKIPDITHHNMTLRSNMIKINTKHTESSNICQRHTTSKHTSSSNIQAINNHMIHSSMPLSKYMMNQTIQPETCSPQHNSQFRHQSSPQLQWNHPKTNGMWDIHAREDLQGHQPISNIAPGLETSRLGRANNPATSNSFCCNSLPRQLPQSCHFKPIECYPSLSISSPSLFGTSPETSLTPSPTTTVLQNYSAASPNPH